MKITKTATLAGLATFLLATTAMAASAVSVKDMPNGNPVSLTGTVEDFDSQHSFTLNDGSGTVKVDLSSAKSLVLKNGDKVNVTGTVDKGIILTDVLAQSVTEDKGFGERVGNAIDSITGDKPSSDARPVTIAALPTTGLIKVSGMVESVSSAKKFTLKDQTGSVDVTIKSDQSASLNKGTHVAVIGYVEKGILGNSINATEVHVTSSTDSP